MRQAIVILFLLLPNTFVQVQRPNREQLFQEGLDVLTGTGPTQNDHDAPYYFRLSAEMGYAPAQVVMGYLNDAGALPNASAREAADWYRKAAEQGDVLGQWLLGAHYVTGSGVARDTNAAQQWLQLAADQGNPFAALTLGGVMAERDYTKAPALYKIAANQGLPRAQFLYARALFDGRGIDQNRFEAYVWFSIALDGGYQAAAKELGTMERTLMLTQDDMSNAKAKAREREKSVSRAVNSRGCTGWDGEFDELPTAPPPKIQQFCR
jgi:hypothetical protein